MPERTDGIPYLDRLLEGAGFHVEPVNAAGLARHIERIQFHAQSARYDWRPDSPYPYLFEDKKDVWLQHAEPEQAHIKELIASLQDYLGEEGILWLGACAVYPELHWRLTLYLAVKLTSGDTDALTAEEQEGLRKKLLDLARLPWFRHGSMPDWLRLRLIKLLQEKNRHHQVRSTIRELLSFAKEDSGEDTQRKPGAIKLPIAWKNVIFHLKHLKRRIAAIFTKTADNSPLNDYVFSNYISSGRSLLAVIIPDRVKHLFFRKGQAVLGLKPAAGVLMAASLSALAFTGVIIQEPSPPMMNPIPAFNFERKTSAGVDGPGGVSRENIAVCLRRFMEYRGVPIIGNAEDAYKQAYPQFISWLGEVLPREAGLNTTQFAFYTGSTETLESDFTHASDRLYVLKRIPTAEDAENIAEQEAAREEMQGIQTQTPAPATALTAAVTPKLLVAPDMAHIPGGSFDMGSKDGEDDEKPVHQVYVSDFYMGKYEVTVGEFREFVKETGYRTDAEKGGGSFVWDEKNWRKKKDANWLNPYFEQTDGHPVVCVSWNDAIVYCNWLSKKEGLTPVYTINGDTVSADFSAKGYRLPTEAEWEYAARCGQKGYKYSWGDGAPAGKHGGNIADESTKRAFSWSGTWEGYDDGYVYTAPVGSFDANEFGLHDMTGNVWEWCWDWYGNDYYKGSPGRNPLGPSDGAYRVVRGGAWGIRPDNVRAAYRNYATPAYANYDLGCRLSRTF